MTAKKKTVAEKEEPQERSKIQASGNCLQRLDDIVTDMKTMANAFMSNGTQDAYGALACIDVIATCYRAKVEVSRLCVHAKLSSAQKEEGM